MLFEFRDVVEHDRLRIPVLRENLRCRGCGAKMRDRTLAMGLLEEVAARGVEAETVAELAGRLPEGIRILETDAHSRISALLCDEPGFVRSVYLPELPNGAALDDERMRNVDLQDMPFPDDHFDVVITTEVMEHVRYVDRAHRELCRVLRPNGVYVFTVPYDPALEHTWQLVDPETDEDLIDVPHIHGDPELRQEGIRAYRVFGRDLVEDLRRCGLAAEFRDVRRPEVGIFGGDLFVARHLEEHV